MRFLFCWCTNSREESPNQHLRKSPCGFEVNRLCPSNHLPISIKCCCFCQQLTTSSCRKQDSVVSIFHKFVHRPAIRRYHRHSCNANVFQLHLEEEYRFANLIWLETIPFRSWLLKVQPLKTRTCVQCLKNRQPKAVPSCRVENSVRIHQRLPTDPPIFYFHK